MPFLCAYMYLGPKDNNKMKLIIKLCVCVCVCVWRYFVRWSVPGWPSCLSPHTSRLSTTCGSMQDETNWNGSRLPCPCSGARSAPVPIRDWPFGSFSTPPPRAGSGPEISSPPRRVSPNPCPWSWLQPQTRYSHALLSFLYLSVYIYLFLNSVLSLFEALSIRLYWVGVSGVSQGGKIK